MCMWVFEYTLIFQHKNVSYFHKNIIHFDVTDVLLMKNIIFYLCVFIDTFSSEFLKKCFLHWLNFFRGVSQHFLDTKTKEKLLRTFTEENYILLLKAQRLRSNREKKMERYQPLDIHIFFSIFENFHFNLLVFTWKLYRNIFNIDYGW